ncbi:MAG: DivIVA domain-containing protein [Actinomycetota bacterium]|nr:DivIVA domain-containing protein [Actinomycetota bacterium]
MATFVVWVTVALVVAGAAFGVVALMTGQADLLVDMPRDSVPTGLPDDRPLRSDEVPALRFDLAFRGYRMDQVDRTLDRLRVDLAIREAEIDSLRRMMPGGGERA